MTTDQDSISFRRVGIVGSGAMGRGIAQLFAQAGVSVSLFDTNPAAVESALRSLEGTFARLVEKGRLNEADAQKARAALSPAASLESLADCDLVVEAIVERLDAKRSLFESLEKIVGESAVLATNTSSLSVTAIAAGSTHPERIAGLHFFNPVPLMKVVEVVRAARTADPVIERLQALVRATGHLAVTTRDTPGFIVNHAGRGYGTEALAALGEGVATVPEIDRILREQVSFDGRGFRLGPLELFDLTALDVSQPVMESIFRQFYDEPRFRPSVIAAQRLAAGLLGRKTNEGFYRYVDGTQQQEAEPAAPAVAVRPPVWVAPGPWAGRVAQAARALGAVVRDTASPGPDELILVAPLGLDASAATRAAARGDDGPDLPAERVVAIDALFPIEPGSCRRRVLMTTPATRAEYRDAAHAIFASDGVPVTMLRDSPGFIAQRVIAMIVSIGSEIAQQRIATPTDIDGAVRAGLGYPLGPLSMGDALGADTICTILGNLNRLTGDPRYRIGGWLRRRAALGLSLLQED